MPQGKHLCWFSQGKNWTPMRGSVKKALKLFWSLAIVLGDVWGCQKGAQLGEQAPEVAKIVSPFIVSFNGWGALLVCLGSFWVLSTFRGGFENINGKKHVTDHQVWRGAAVGSMAWHEQNRRSHCPAPCLLHPEARWSTPSVPSSPSACPSPSVPKNPTF